MAARPVDDPEIPGQLETGCTVFADSIYLMADCLDDQASTDAGAELNDQVANL